MTQQEEEYIKSKYNVSTDKIKIAIFGQPGAGKSSLINALCGEPLAKTGSGTDTTQEAQVIERGDVLFVDLPGYGTSRFPAHAFCQSFNPLQYDLFICVFANKFHQADTDFFTQLVQVGKPCIFVCNKVDLIYEEGKTLAQCQAAITADLRRQVGKAAITPLFVACRSDKLEGIAAVDEAIVSQMDAARQEKYRLAAKSYTKEQLDIKSQICHDLIARSSKLAAANGFNPLLGLDVTLDLAILTTLYKSIRMAYGINEAKVKNSLVKVETKNYLLKGMSKEGINFILKTATKHLAQKTVFKFVPVVGQAAAGFIGYNMIKKAGEDYRAACYQVAQEELYKELHVQD